MSSLQGYVTATYDQIVEILGEPTYKIEQFYDNEDFDDIGEKVETEWEFYDDAGNLVYIYDWKCYDSGATSRSGKNYTWHIGGKNHDAVDAVEKFGFRKTDYT